jgi:hypothetical protein
VCQKHVASIASFYSASSYLVLALFNALRCSFAVIVCAVWPGWEYIPGPVTMVRRAEMVKNRSLPPWR